MLQLQHAVSMTLINKKLCVLFFDNKSLKLNVYFMLIAYLKSETSYLSSAREVVGGHGK